ncbi:hypothetical protein ILFOPFJJ_07004 [Ensifer psoraleae]|nr:hypothetical protein [Sinorhizobium psoraleae]
MSGQHITDALIVIRIELEHSLVMLERFVLSAKPPECCGKTGPRPHIRPGFQKAPEMAGTLLEPFRPERLFTRLDPFLIPDEGLLDRFGFLFGKQHVGVCAKRRDSERFSGKGYTLAPGRRFPCVIHDLLRSIDRIAFACVAEKAGHQTFHPPEIRHCGTRIVIAGLGALCGFLSRFLRYKHLHLRQCQAARMCSKSMRRPKSRSKAP